MPKRLNKPKNSVSVPPYKGWDCKITSPGCTNANNLVVIADSTLEPLTLLDRCQAIEQAYERRRDPDHPGGPRTLDIDLIVVGKRTSETPELMLPHPHAHERAFVLVPWLDIERRATLPQGRVDDLVATMDTSVVQKLTDVRIEKP